MADAGPGMSVDILRLEVALDHRDYLASIVAQNAAIIQLLVEQHQNEPEINVEVTTPQKSLAEKVKDDLKIKKDE